MAAERFQGIRHKNAGQNFILRNMPQFRIELSVKNHLRRPVLFRHFAIDRETAGVVFLLPDFPNAFVGDRHVDIGIVNFTEQVVIVVKRA